MQPTKEQIEQLEQLKATSIIQLPQDGIIVRNLYVSLVNNTAHICTTCTSTVAEYKRRLLNMYERFVPTETILDDAKEQLKVYKSKPTKKDVQAKYPKKVNRFKLEDELIYINGSKAPSFKWENKEVLPLDFLSDDDLINNISK